MTLLYYVLPLPAGEHFQVPKYVVVRYFYTICIIFTFITTIYANF